MSTAQKGADTGGKNLPNPTPKNDEHTTKHATNNAERKAATPEREPISSPATTAENDNKDRFFTPLHQMGLLEVWELIMEGELERLQQAKTERLERKAQVLTAMKP